jgi:hypothetical protein
MASPEENPVGSDTILSESGEVAREMLHWSWNCFRMLSQPFDLFSDPPRSLRVETGQVPLKLRGLFDPIPHEPLIAGNGFVRPAR